MVFRHELKYLCSDIQAEIIKHRLSPLLHPDPHAGKNGEYLIRSVYFDGFGRRCYYENEDSADPRHKYRIRIYNCARNRVTLEKKIKRNGMTAKESCLINEKLCDQMLGRCNCTEHIGKFGSLFDAWIMERNRSGLAPAVIVQYKRIPLIYNLGNVRITFDSQICASADYSTFFEKTITNIAVLPSGYQVLEVKYDDYLPDVIYRLCDIGHLMQTTFSKFYLCCKALEGNLYVI